MGFPEIRHLAVLVWDPERCARQLALLTNGEALPFRARYLEGGWICLWQPEHNHLIELIPPGFRMCPGPDGAVFQADATVQPGPCHVQLALDCSRPELETRAAAAGLTLFERLAYGGPLLEAWPEPDFLVEICLI